MVTFVLSPLNEERTKTKRTLGPGVRGAVRIRRGCDDSGSAAPLFAQVLRGLRGWGGGRKLRVGYTQTSEGLVSAVSKSICFRLIHLVEDNVAVFL